MRTVYPYTEHHENPISHPSIASAVSRDRAARTSTTGPNCEKKLRTTPTNRERTHHTSFVSHVTSSPPTRESANPRIRESATIHPFARSPPPRDRARAHPRVPSSTVRSSPPTNIFDPADDDVYGAMIHRVGVILDVSCALLP
jgi:hypothetical protein